MSLVLAGSGLNALVVAVNGGRMPVLGQAMEFLGKETSLAKLNAGLDPIHTPYGPETALPWLGDWIPVPLPLAAVVSPGDILIALRLVLFVNTVTQPGYGRVRLQAESSPSQG